MSVERNVLWTEFYCFVFAEKINKSVCSTRIYSKMHTVVLTIFKRWKLVENFSKNDYLVGGGVQQSPNSLP